MADRYLTNATNAGSKVVNDVANWSTTTGGAGGASVPVAGDAVIIDVSSFSSGYVLTVDTTWAATSYLSTAANAAHKLDVASQAVTLSGSLTMAEAGQVLTGTSSGSLTIGGTLLQIYTADEANSVSALPLIFTNAAPTIRYETSSSGAAPDFYYIEIAASSTLTLRNRSSSVGNDLTVKDNFRVTAGGAATITFDTTDTATNLVLEAGLHASDIDFDGVFTITNMTAIEHENLESGGPDKRVSGDDRLSITWGAGATTYDVTGPGSNGPETFLLNSDLTGSTSMVLAIQKQAILDLCGYTITNCDDIRVGDLAADPAHLICRGGSITAAGFMELRGDATSSVNCGYGTITIGEYVEYDDGGILTGYAGGTIDFSSGTTTPAGDTIFCSDAGDNDNDGSTAELAVKTFARVAALSTGTDRCVFNGGDTFPITANVSIAALSIGAYGTGAATFSIDDSVTITGTTAGCRWYESTLNWLIPSSASVYAKIASSRTSGVGPLIVHFDAIAEGGSTASTLSTPYNQRLAMNELDFSWNFGDTTSTAWTNSTQSHNKDKTAQTAHCFESAGTYVVTLTVKDDAGNTATDTMTITVNDITLESGYTGYLLDAGGAGDYTAWDTAAAAVETALASGPVRLLVTAGDSFTTTGLAISEPANALRIIKSGSGTDPIVAAAADGDPGYLFEGCTDQLIQGIDFNGTGASSTNIGVGSRSGFTTQNDHCYLYKCTVRNFENGYENTGNIDMSRMGLIDCIVRDTLEYGIYTNYATNFTVMATKFLSVCRGDGAEHPIRCAWSRSNVAYCTFDTAKDGTGTGGTVIKDRGWHKYSDVRGIDGARDATNVYNSFHNNSIDIGTVASDDDVNDFFVIGPSTSSGDVQEWVEYNLFENNFIRAAHTPGGDNRIFLIQGSNTIVRNNILVVEQNDSTVYLAVIQQRSATNPVPSNVLVYSNTMYIGVARGVGNDDRVIRVDDGTGHIGQNNICGYIDGQTEAFGYMLGGTGVAGITGLTNAVLAGTSECNAVFKSASGDSFKLKNSAKGRVAANPTAATSQSNLITTGTAVNGLISDYAGLARDLTTPDIGAHEHVKKRGGTMMGCL